MATVVKLRKDIDKEFAIHDIDGKRVVLKKAGDFAEVKESDATSYINAYGHLLEKEYVDPAKIEGQVAKEAPKVEAPVVEEVEAPEATSDDAEEEAPKKKGRPAKK